MGLKYALKTWLAKTLAFTVLSLTPGPSGFMALAQSLSRGLNAALYWALSGCYVAS